MSSSFDVFEASNGGRVKAWVRDVPVDARAVEQLRRTASLPFIHGHVAAMPDVHMGVGSTVGSVIPTKGAILPAAVGVDIGCGMMAVQTTLRDEQLPDSLRGLRDRIERKVPVGVGKGGEYGKQPVPNSTINMFRQRGLEAGLDRISAKYRGVRAVKALNQLGTLGGGNHFIEVCVDETGGVWAMLHSGSRGVGNSIGQTFIAAARKALEKRVLGYHVPDRDLAFFVEGEPLFDDYIEAMLWAQDYALANREVMMRRVLEAMRESLPPFKTAKVAINCHHNYAQRETHGGEEVWVTRKGAVRATQGELGIIPGSMGARSFIVRGKGNAESFHSCSHGAGRVMSRSAAKKRFTLADHREAVAGVECRTDEGVLDETPAAYKDIDKVMAAQSDLVEILHTLKQVVCVKG